MRSIVVQVGISPSSSFFVSGFVLAALPRVPQQPIRMWVPGPLAQFQMSSHQVEPLWSEMWPFFPCFGTGTTVDGLRRVGTWTRTSANSVHQQSVVKIPAVSQRETECLVVFPSSLRSVFLRNIWREFLHNLPEHLQLRWQRNGPQG